MDVNSVFGGDSLKAADLQGREFTLTIASVEPKKFDNGTKLVIRFAGAKKCLVANKTNAKRIAFMHGTETDLWIGKSITLYADFVEYQGQTVQAIRVKPPAPVAAAPAPRAAPAVPVPQDAPDFDDDVGDQVPF